MVLYLPPHAPFIKTHRNWNVWRPLSNYHAKLPDLSAALFDVTLSVLVTKVPLVVAPDNQTHPHAAHSGDVKHTFATFCPPETKTYIFSCQMMP